MRESISFLSFFYQHFGWRPTKMLRIYRPACTGAGGRAYICTLWLRGVYSLFRFIKRGVNTKAHAIFFFKKKEAVLIDSQRLIRWGQPAPSAQACVDWRTWLSFFIHNRRYIFKLPARHFIPCLITTTVRIGISISAPRRYHSKAFESASLHLTEKLDVWYSSTEQWIENWCACPIVLLFLFLAFRFWGFFVIFASINTNVDCIWRWLHSRALLAKRGQEQACLPYTHSERAREQERERERENVR